MYCSMACVASWCLLIFMVNQSGCWSTKHNQELINQWVERGFYHAVQMRTVYIFDSIGCMYLWTNQSVSWTRDTTIDNDSIIFILLVSGMNRFIQGNYWELWRLLTLTRYLWVDHTSSWHTLFKDIWDSPVELKICLQFTTLSGR